MLRHKPQVVGQIVGRIMSVQGNAVSAQELARAFLAEEDERYSARRLSSAMRLVYGIETTDEDIERFIGLLAAEDTL